MSVICRVACYSLSLLSLSLSFSLLLHISSLLIYIRHGYSVFKFLSLSLASIFKRDSGRRRREMKGRGLGGEKLNEEWEVKGNKWSL